MTNADLLAASRRGIRFSTPMVQAILTGQKTRTAQVMSPQPIREPCADSTMWYWKDCCWIEAGLGFPESGIDDYAMCKPGDIVYVRESWSPADCCDEPAIDCDTHQGRYMYKADKFLCRHFCTWRSSMFMPEDAARIFLRITGVKVQRYRGVTGKENIAEGIACPVGPEHGLYVSLCTARWALKGKWRMIQNFHRTKKGLAFLVDNANPWCFIYDLERVIPDDK